MDTSKLRRGNYVSVRTSPVFRINRIDVDYVQGVTITSELNLLHAVPRCSEFDYNTEPIPLTKRWLFDFGFIESTLSIHEKHIKTLNKTLIVPFDKDNEIRMSMPCGNGIMTIAKNIVYVHELQNLFHALTKEELTLKK